MNRAARHAVSHGGVAHFVLGNAGHKAIQTVAVGHGAALIERRIAGAAQFVPADSRLLIGASSDLYGVADQERLVGAKISVLEARLQAIADRIHVISSASARRLRYAERVDRAGYVVATRLIAGDGDLRFGKSGTLGRRPVDVKAPQIQLRGGDRLPIRRWVLNAQEVLMPARGRSRGAIEIGGNQAVRQIQWTVGRNRVGIAEALLGSRGAADDHVGAIKSTG